jgi:hypothetical protein
VNDQHKYDNDVQPDNKFGHTLRLLTEHLPSDLGEGGVHLDLACGFGHIADHIKEAFGLHYIGVDVDDLELDHLRERGLEAHAADLTDPDVGERLRKVLDGRRLVSVTFLDGLEHLTNGTHVLDALGELLAEHRALAVTSVPNVTHLDVGIKALLGTWDYTEAGLLDVTHFQLYSEKSLTAALRSAGLRRIGREDVLVARSDQHFPGNHVGLSEATTFSRYLRSVRADAEPHGLVNQFVWALTAAPAQPTPHYLDPSSTETDRFLSVIMRTQGRRLQELREALVCLSAQSCQDFEVLIVAHRTNAAEQKDVEVVIDDQPPALRERIRLVLLDRGPRSAPINAGIEAATGRYVAIFDDDDVVMGDWVKEFFDAEREHGGRILRTIALKQGASVDTVRGLPGIRSTSAPEPAYDNDFSLAGHLVANQSPPIGWIFPRSLATHFGLRYDDSMTTTEDWEFLLRAAQIAGVTDIGRGTAIYRWWETRESSRTAHSVDEWAQNQREIERRIDSRPFLLPAGETRQLRTDLLELTELRKRTRRMERRVTQLERKSAQKQTQIRRLQRRLRRSRQQGQGQGQAAPATLRQRLRPRTRLKAVVRRFRGA